MELLNSQQIVALRPTVERPQPGTGPLDTLIEREASTPGGESVDVLTVLLRGSECPFRCLMCDLWKSTHSVPTPIGALPAQLESALDQCSQAPWIKLYNASNFFAPVNVPTADLPRLAQLLHPFRRIIVENHPRLLTPEIERFSESLPGRLEIAMGLETIHPEVLPALNKNMQLDDFAKACHWLQQRQIDIRAFVLLRPPGLSESEGVDWCSRSIDYAVDHGCRHVSIIPVRSGNGAIEELQRRGQFQPPLAASLELVLERYASHPNAVVTADLWDWDGLVGLCPQCRDARKARLGRMNMQQCVLAPDHRDCSCP